MLIVTLTFEAALHHGSGFGWGGLIDRTVLRDASGVPYLAGSALKGRLRHACLRLDLAEGKPACRYGDGESVCRGEQACAICTLFGSPWRRGALLFGDAVPEAQLAGVWRDLQELAGHRPPAESGVRQRTAMDRATGTVRPQLLFSSEVLPEGLTFRSEIRGNIGAHQPLLKDGCGILSQFGADGARGLGKCKWELTEATA